MGVTRVGVTGHRGLPPDTESRVETALRGLLSRVDNGLVGVTCLADGADQIFALLVVELGGELEVIVPAARYRDGLPAASHPTYDALLDAASDVERLPYVESTSQSHMAASELMLGRVDRLVAVWDGRPARGEGG
ncbi:MAG: hypothetical protein GEU96_15100, partial [Propionibacteriales bacterium]|nr:hypothetical protein [Propionibacteriales bacterium]